jgi:hypothetical protein
LKLRVDEVSRCREGIEKLVGKEKEEEEGMKMVE